jgi:hypothetical protein
LALSGASNGDLPMREKTRKGNNMNLYDKHNHKMFCADAIMVQDACNLRAIARLLVAAADYAADNFGGTQASYNDPAVILIVAKIESLVRSEREGRYYKAYDKCTEISK